MKILLVEDERGMAEATAQVLRKNNYAVDLCFDGEAGLDNGLSGVYDVIILDIMLPGLDGISLLKQLRGEGVETPVLLLTALGEAGDKVHGLDSGADDYLAKPFSMDELLARLRALGRRGSQLRQNGILEFGDISLDPLNLSLRRAGKEFRLTFKEGQLLELLMDRRGNVVSKGAIIEKLWGFESDAEDNHAEVYISFLRKKLKGMKANVCIKTMRGAGYYLALSEDGV